jgi:hypothetical protein
MTRVEFPEDLKDAVTSQAEAAAHRVAEAADKATAAVSKQAAKTGARSGGRGLKSGVKVGKAGAKVGVAGTKVGVKGSKLGLRGFLFGARERGRNKLNPAVRPAAEAKLAAQLTKTTRELANEATDLNDAILALQDVIKTNRRDGAKSRTKLIAGFTLGALAAYHLDSEHGAERRAATAARLQHLVG